MKDMIKSSDFRVSAREVDDATMEVDGIAEVAVTSVEDKARGEAIKAHVVLRDGEQMSFESTRRALRGRLPEYFHAHRLNYAVAATPNRQEYDQGFFVKLGNGAADLKPIAHLYKTQVYQMAEFLGVPEEIRTRLPTTDTYSMPQNQEEFDFSVPYEKMDYCMYGLNHGIDPEEVGTRIDLTAERVKRVYNDIRNKRNATSCLHMPPVLMEEVPEIDIRWRHELQRL